MKKTLILAIVGVVALLFVVAGIHAKTEVVEVIKMENKAYSAHTKGIVEFSHKKHAEEYAKAHPDFYKNGCGECHHNDKNEPLKDLKMGDDVHGCIECHKKPGEKPKGQDAPKLTDQQAREYHAEAIHDNCKGCHNNVNKATGKKDAPVTCSKCHPKSGD